LKGLLIAAFTIEMQSTPVYTLRPPRKKKDTSQEVSFTCNYALNAVISELHELYSRDFSNDDINLSHLNSDDTLNTSAR